MKLIAMTKLQCPVDDCEWESGAVEVSKDDGSITTSYRDHVDWHHRPAPKRLTWDHLQE